MPAWHPLPVPRFTPFPALRYSAVEIDDVIAPPYDVLSDSDVEQLRGRSPINICHVDVPRVRDGDGRYDAAAALLREWVETGVMTVDDEPTFTIYRLRFTDASGTDRNIVGVLGGLEVVDEGAGGVLGHERVTPKASSDRLELTRSTQANLSPIWGLSLAGGLSDLLAEPAEHLSSVTVEGVEHVVERVRDAGRIAAISEAIGSDDVLIADGHHRYGIARSYRDEVRAETGGSHGLAEDTLAFISELSVGQLSVEAIHRLYQGTSVEELTSHLSTRFELHEAEGPNDSTLKEMERRGALFLVAPGGGWWLTPRDGAFDHMRGIDGAWLEEALADLDHRVTYQHGVRHVVDAVGNGDAVAGVLIRPVSVAEIQRTAREGDLMPPKSTFFTPKLRTGLVVRSVI